MLSIWHRISFNWILIFAVSSKTESKEVDTLVISPQIVSKAFWTVTVSKQYLVETKVEVKSIKQKPLIPLDCNIWFSVPKLSGIPWISVTLWVILTRVSTSEI